MRKSRLQRFEPLERRLCLSVDATQIAGNLVVTGDAVDAVTITADAADPTKFTVEEGAVSIPVEGVTGGIQVLLRETDPAAPSADDVTVDLGGQSVDFFFANLGTGDNTLVVQNGTVEHALRYFGGPDADVLRVDGDATIDHLALVILGRGENEAHLNGQFNGHVAVLGADGADTVNIGASALASENVFVRLGAGANNFTLDGTVKKFLGVFGGAGTDTADINGDVGRAATLALGHGDNAVTVNGSVGWGLSVYGGRDMDTLEIGGSVGGMVSAVMGHGDNSLTLEATGTVGSSVIYGGGDGNDTVTTMADADNVSQIGGSLIAGLGRGDNSLTHDGHIGHNLIVTSHNPDDTVTVNGTVDGRTWIRLDWRWWW